MARGRHQKSTFGKICVVRIERAIGNMTRVTFGANLSVEERDELRQLLSTQKPSFVIEHTVNMTSLEICFDVRGKEDPATRVTTLIDDFFDFIEDHHQARTPAPSVHVIGLNHGPDYVNNGHRFALAGHRR